MIPIKHLQIVQILALNNLSQIDMPLNKPNQRWMYANKFQVFITICVSLLSPSKVLYYSTEINSMLKKFSILSGIISIG